MKNAKSLILRVFLLFIAIIAISTILTEGKTYIFKNYFETTQLKDQEQDYLTKLNWYVLNPIDKEATVKNIDATAEEIKYYREYYGTLAEQIEEIQSQYTEEINDAEAAEQKNEPYIEALKNERDTKIADIQKNFEDSEYVKDKIVSFKKAAFEKDYTRYEKERKNFLNSYAHFGYSFKEDTGETVEFNQSKARVYENKVTLKAPSTSDIDELFINEAEYEPGIMNEYVNIVTTENTYVGSIFIPKSAAKMSDYQEDYKAFMISKVLYFVLWLAGIVSIVLLYTTYKLKKEHFQLNDSLEEKIKKIPLDIHLVIVFIIALIIFDILDGGSRLIYQISYNERFMYNLGFYVDTIVRILFNFAVFLVEIILGYKLYMRLREGQITTLWKQTFSSQLLQVIQQVFLNRTIGIQTFGMLIVFFLGGYGLYIGFMEAQYFIVYSIFFFFILVPTTFIYLRRVGYLNKIMEQTEDMAAGRLTTNIRVKGNSPFAKHAENLNALQEGVKKSVQLQAKSERLKSELITNVSHDLRTPLTSIITYTDLLKNPDLSQEEREKYVGILDAKAERLKVLIEDLFEVSKMTSGNVELVRQKADIAQLLQQVAGEHSDAFKANDLDLRVTITNQPILSNIDGQKMWRVLDNVLNNAMKYSLTGTRVYVHLSEMDGNAVLVLKNVSKYELNGEATELVERFKRADLARNTEGSGLGLAIATSIIDLHGGTLTIDADGDLFKVTITIPSM